MNFQPLLELAQHIRVHATAAILAVGLGGVQFVLPKGSRLHRWLGYAWVALMASVAITGLLIYEIRMVGPFSPIDLLSLFELITLFWAVRAARQGLVSRYRRAMIMLYVFRLSLAGAFTFLPGRMMHVMLTG